MYVPLRSLGAYSASAALGDELWGVVEGWSSLAQWTVGVQLIRAADSVAANIAEASGRWQPDDKKRLLIIARGSLRETEHWIDRAAARDLIENGYEGRLNEISRSLSGLINAQRRR